VVYKCPGPIKGTTREPFAKLICPLADFPDQPPLLATDERMTKLSFQGHGNPVVVDRSSDVPLAEQVYAQLREAIESKRLRRGDRIPPSRGLAATLNLARNTVLAAYERLDAEQYIESRTGAGTYVVWTEPRTKSASKPLDGEHLVESTSLLSRAARHVRHVSKSFETSVTPFLPDVPDRSLFPWVTWAQLLHETWKNPNAEMIHATEPAGYGPLRREIASMLRSTRGVICEPAQVFITSGTRDGLGFISQLLFDEGTPVWVEDPCYPSNKLALTSQGIEVQPVSVDEDGLNVKLGMKLHAHARGALVAPSCQHPLGVTMSLDRRKELIAWARAGNRWIIEDDYECEFVLPKNRLPSIQGLADGMNVAYVGTFSKTLLPSLRLGYVIVPSSLVDSARKLRAATDGPPSVIAQPALAKFISTGQFTRHLERTRSLYSVRREFLKTCLHRYLGTFADLQGEPALHLIVRFSSGGFLGHTDIAVSERAATFGVIVPPLSRYHSGIRAPQGLLLGYAAYPEFQLERATQLLTSALEGIF
jgi:GntR family transcriptional regulator/MocR family aminotransferase